MATQYILRFDDISPQMSWSKFLPLKKELENMGVLCVLGVVPDCQDDKLNCEPIRRDFFDFVRHCAGFGDTIAQHGTTHVYSTKDSGVLGINARSEFAGLERANQLARLLRGKQLLESEQVWQPYFMAPAHAFDRTTLQVLRELGFKALTDGYGFYPYRMEGMVLVPQLTSTPLSSGFGVCTICVHINTMSEKGVEELLSFIKTRSSLFVNFKQIAEKAPNHIALSHVVLRLLTANGLKLKRKLRDAVSTTVWS